MTTVAMERGNGGAEAPAHKDVPGHENGSAHEAAAIRLEHVSKRFDGRAVLDDVTIDVPAGTAFCLLGRSGTEDVP